VGVALQGDEGWGEFSATWCDLAAGASAAEAAVGGAAAQLLAGTVGVVGHVGAVVEAEDDKVLLDDEELAEGDSDVDERGERQSQRRPWPGASRRRCAPAGRGSAQ
jgi:hypothetical protein